MKPSMLEQIRAELWQAVVSGDMTGAEAVREYEWAQADAWNEERNDRRDNY